MSVSAKSPAKPFPYLLDGKWISDGEPLEISSPFDGSAVGVTSWADEAALERAVQASVRAFEQTRKMPSY